MVPVIDTGLWGQVALGSSPRFNRSSVHKESLLTITFNVLIALSCQMST